MNIKSYKICDTFVWVVRIPPEIQNSYWNNHEPNIDLTNQEYKYAFDIERDALFLGLNMGAHNTLLVFYRLIFLVRSALDFRSLFPIGFVCLKTKT